jgi:hypothetical protein
MRSRWRGDVPVGLVLWLDMLVVGTAINVVTTVAALLLFATDFPTLAGAAVYFSPLPYNLFVLIAVWRSAAKVHEPRRSAARACAVLWFLVAAMF